MFEKYEIAADEGCEKNINRYHVISFDVTNFISEARKEDGKFSYKVTKAGTTGKTTGTVTLTKAKNKNIKNAVIGATVKIDGITYKITAIANGAFKNSKRLTSVTIGANVTSIGKNAFTGCGSLKTITIKGKSLKKIGANAFKGINKKATIKVPKAKKKAYTKLLKNKGQAKTVKIK